MCRLFRLMFLVFLEPDKKDDERRNNDDEDDGALFV